MSLPNSYSSNHNHNYTDQPQSKDDYSLTAYQYNLPPQLIAQEPVTPRDRSRLMVVASQNNHHHVYFRDLPQLLCPGELIILNKTRVIPARMYGYITSGAKVEVLLLEPRPPRWLALGKPGRRLQPGSVIVFGPNLDKPVL